ncbi:MAG: thioredoxin domain-containing protein [Bacteroidota bacterium]
MIESERLTNLLEPHGEALVALFFCKQGSGSAFLMKSVLEDLLLDYQTQVGFLEINVEEDLDLATTFSIVEIPTLILFNTLTHSLEGVYRGISSKHSLRSEFNQVLSRMSPAA